MSAQSQHQHRPLLVEAAEPLPTAATTAKLPPPSSSSSGHRRQASHPGNFQNATVPATADTAGETGDTGRPDADEELTPLVIACHDISMFPDDDISLVSRPVAAGGFQLSRQFAQIDWPFTFTRSCVSVPQCSQIPCVS